MLYHKLAEELMQFHQFLLILNQFARQIESNVELIASLRHPPAQSCYCCFGVTFGGAAIVEWTEMDRKILSPTELRINHYKNLLDQKNSVWKKKLT